MISAWHLLWIVPLSAFSGIMFSALCHAASDRDDWKEDENGEQE